MIFLCSRDLQIASSPPPPLNIWYNFLLKFVCLMLLGLIFGQFPLSPSHPSPIPLARVLNWELFDLVPEVGEMVQNAASPFLKRQANFWAWGFSLSLYVCAAAPGRPMGISSQEACSRPTCPSGALGGEDPPPPPAGGCSAPWAGPLLACTCIGGPSACLEIWGFRSLFI